MLLAALASLSVVAAPASADTLAVSDPHSFDGSDWRRQDMNMHAARTIGATHYRVWAWWQQLQDCRYNWRPDGVASLYRQIDLVKHNGMTPIVSFTGVANPDWGKPVPPEGGTCPGDVEPGVPFTFGNYSTSSRKNDARVHAYGRMVREISYTLYHDKGVRSFSFWNEPDHAGFLAVYDSKGRRQIFERVLDQKDPDNGRKGRKDLEINKTFGIFRALHKAGTRGLGAAILKKPYDGVSTKTGVNEALRQTSVLCCETTGGNNAGWWLHYTTNRPMKTFRFDKIAVHAYQFNDRPGRTCGSVRKEHGWSGNHGVSCLGQVTAKQIHKKFRGLNVWVTEMGYRRREDSKEYNIVTEKIRRDWAGTAMNEMRKHSTLQTWYHLGGSDPGGGCTVKSGTWVEVSKDCKTRNADGSCVKPGECEKGNWVTCRHVWNSWLLDCKGRPARMLEELRKTAVGKFGRAPLGFTPFYNRAALGGATCYWPGGLGGANAACNTKATAWAADVEPVAP